MEKLFPALRSFLAAGRDAVLASLVASSGSVPRGAGAKMLVLADGAISGTIGGGPVEHRSIALARELLAAKKSRLQHFDFSPEDRDNLGMVCGGHATVYFQYLSAQDAQLRALLAYEAELRAAEKDAWLVTLLQENTRMGIYAGDALHFLDGVTPAQIEPYLRAKAALLPDAFCFVEPLVESGRVYVFGGGHVAQALVPILAGVGFRPVIFEDRPQFAQLALFPGALDAVLGDFSRICDFFAVTERDCIVIMTRGHAADYTVLEQALGTPAYYIGLIGSRSKMAATREKLRQAGFGQRDMERIHNPIGLPILAETPAEIAISVAAEMILARAQRRRNA